VTVPVALSRPVAYYRRGFAAALLDAGFDLHQPDDLCEWAARAGRCAVVVSLPAGTDLDAVAGLPTIGAGVVVLVLLTDPTARSYREVLGVGGFPVAWDVPPPGILRVLQAALNGQVLVPQGVAAGLAWYRGGDEGLAEPPGCPPLGATEIHILARVARGDTDRRIAAELRVSERTVRRRLRMIFSKLGVESRVQAGIYAAQRGLAGRFVFDQINAGPSEEPSPDEGPKAPPHADAVSVVETGVGWRPPQVVTTELRGSNSSIMFGNVDLRRTDGAR